jgi:2'-5' RNA ligase
MRGRLPKASYPREENLHVTLKFLGDASDRQLEALCDSMRKVKVTGALLLAAAGMAFFPQRGHARVVVASMSGSEGVVAALHGAVEQRCAKMGFTSEQRRYHAHVTLARVARGLARAEQNELAGAVERLWPGPEFEVGQFALFASQLHPHGARYTRLATFPLRAKT